MERIAMSQEERDDLDWLKRVKAGINTTAEFINYMQHPPVLQLYMPGLVFIDSDGQIRAQYEGRDAFLEESGVEKNIRAKVEELLTPPAAAPKKTVAQKGTAKRSEERRVGKECR